MVSPTTTTVELNGDLAVMRFEGDITSTSEEALIGSYRGLSTEVTRIILDFSRVPYLISRGIGLVIQILLAAQKASQRVVCFGLSAHFIKIFRILGLANYTSLCLDEAAARAAAAW
jgi:anti-sigma B factor antagonist